MYNKCNESNNELILPIIDVLYDKISKYVKNLVKQIIKLSQLKEAPITLQQNIKNM